MITFGTVIKKMDSFKIAVQNSIAVNIFDNTSLGSVIFLLFTKDALNMKSDSKDIYHVT